MAVYLGIDTSNYTTSAAAFDDVSGCVFQKKMLLPVKSGERGLRQSDAVFHHTQQLFRVVSGVLYLPFLFPAAKTQSALPAH